MNISSFTCINRSNNTVLAELISDQVYSNTVIQVSEYNGTTQLVDWTTVDTLNTITQNISYTITNPNSDKIKVRLYSLACGPEPTNTPTATIPALTPTPPPTTEPTPTPPPPTEPTPTPPPPTAPPPTNPPPTEPPPTAPPPTNPPPTEPPPTAPPPTNPPPTEPPPTAPSPTPPPPTAPSPTPTITPSPTPEFDVIGSDSGSDSGSGCSGPPCKSQIYRLELSCGSGSGSGSCNCQVSAPGDAGAVLNPMEYMQAMQDDPNWYTDIDLAPFCQSGDICRGGDPQGSRIHMEDLTAEQYAQYMIDLKNSCNGRSYGPFPLNITGVAANAAIGTLLPTGNDIGGRNLADYFNRTNDTIYCPVDYGSGGGPSDGQLYMIMKDNDGNCIPVGLTYITCDGCTVGYGVFCEVPGSGSGSGGDGECIPIETIEPPECKQGIPMPDSVPDQHWIWPPIVYRKEMDNTCGGGSDGGSGSGSGGSGSGSGIDDVPPWQGSEETGGGQGSGSSGPMPVWPYGERDVMDENIITDMSEEGVWTLGYIEKLNEANGNSKSAIWFKRKPAFLYPQGNVFADDIFIVGNPKCITINTEINSPTTQFGESFVDIVNSLLKVQNVHMIQRCGGYFIEILKWFGDNSPKGDGSSRLCGPEYSILDPDNIYTVPGNTTTATLASLTETLI